MSLNAYHFICGHVVNIDATGQPLDPQLCSINDNIKHHSLPCVCANCAAMLNAQEKAEAAERAERDARNANNFNMTGMRKAIREQCAEDFRKAIHSTTQQKTTIPSEFAQAFQQETFTFRVRSRANN